MKYLPGMLVLIILLACRTDSDRGGAPVAEQLVGTWKVVEATRNNRPALSLENSEFYIGDSLFSTNFLPDTSSYPYSYDGRTIRLTDEAQSLFIVSRTSQDTLTFRTEIRNFDFKFTAVRKNEDHEISNN